MAIPIETNAAEYNALVRQFTWEHVARSLVDAVADPSLVAELSVLLGSPQIRASFKFGVSSYKFTPTAMTDFQASHPELTPAQVALVQTYAERQRDAQASAPGTPQLPPGDIFILLRLDMHSAAHARKRDALLVQQRYHFSRSLVELVELFCCQFDLPAPFPPTHPVNLLLATLIHNHWVVNLLHRIRILAFSHANLAAGPERNGAIAELLRFSYAFWRLAAHVALTEFELSMLVTLCRTSFGVSCVSTEHV